MTDTGGSARRHHPARPGPANPTTASFAGTGGTLLTYDDQGSGPPVVLLHGFAANAFVNWHRPGVVRALVAAGYRVITPDLRGHGRSDAPHEVAAYAFEHFVADLAGLLDRAGVHAAALGGYSLGARLALLSHPFEPRICSLVLGGVGESTPRQVLAEVADATASAMEAARPGDVTARRARSFRAFADATGSDRAALACLQRALPSWPALTPGLVGIPALVVPGSQDTLAGRPGPLAAAIPAGRAATVAGNHMNAVLNPAFARAVVAFLDSQARW